MTAHYRPAVLAPFGIRSFRIQWPSDLLTSCAFEMETLILGWFILVETGSVLLLSLFGALLYFGTLLSPLFGVAGDRVGHRNLLCAMRAFYTLLAATLMAIALAGALSPLAVFCIAGLMGLVRPSDLGVRWALVAHIVPGEQLMGAMAISRTTSDAARVLGALTGAGLFSGFGISVAYGVVTALYALGLLLVLAMGRAPGALSPVPAPAAGPARSLPPRSTYWGDLIEGLALVWSTPALLAAILLAALVNLLAFPISIQLLPYVAREVYAVNETGLGYLVASFAGGALLGSVATSIRRGIAPARTMILSSLGWFLFLLAFAQMQTLWSGAAMLALAGFAQSLSMVTLAVVLLGVAGGKFRGRIMGVRMLAIYSLPLGALGGGALIDWIGFHATGTLYALAGMALTLAIAWRWRAHLWRAGLAVS
ncbi:MAG TPA: MFS transporter [Hyphomicrobiaceae bacterium]|nr:MFS transporter [Hyphomicrobiaceae bacterium]